MDFCHEGKMTDAGDKPAKSPRPNPASLVHDKYKKSFHFCKKKVKSKRKIAKSIFLLAFLLEAIKLTYSPRSPNMLSKSCAAGKLPSAKPRRRDYLSPQNQSFI
jgi:hypothetical protein